MDHQLAQEQEARGLRVQHFCYPSRTRSTGPLPVPVPDLYSKLLPDPTRTRGYTLYPSLSSLPMRSLCSCQAFNSACSYSLINRLMMFMMMRYVYNNTAKKESLEIGK